MKKIKEIIIRFITPIRRKGGADWLFWCKNCREVKRDIGHGYNQSGEAPGRLECNQCGYVKYL